MRNEARSQESEARRRNAKKKPGARSQKPEEKGTGMGRSLSLLSVSVPVHSAISTPHSAFLIHNGGTARGTQICDTRHSAMTLKRLLIFIPLLLIAGLLQSYFWVPTYENQTTGNPQRLRKYIEGSTADAQILNPILNADTASSNITGYVFEGLLDLDENLNLRGRLATDWHITENAYLLVNPQKRLPDGTPATGPEL